MASKLPPREQQIAARLVEFRKQRLITRVALAKRIGVESDRLTSYEHARVPLRADVAMKLWSEFALSPQWLATGNGDEYLPSEPFAQLLPEIDRREKFSEAYERALRQPINDVLGSEEGTFETLAHILQAEGASVPSRIAFYRSRFGRVLKLPVDEQSEKSKLDDVNNGGHFAVVLKLPKDVDDLLDRVRSATSEPGAKKALAGILGIRQQHLSAWLSPTGKSPSADHALALLKWLTVAEAKQKETPAVLRTQPARKARTKQTRETKQSSGPPPK